MLLPTRNAKRPLGVSAVGAVAAILLWLGGSRVAPAEDPFASMAVQRPAREAAAPGFRLQTPEGAPVALADLRGKVVALYYSGAPGDRTAGGSCPSWSGWRTSSGRMG